MASDIIRGSKFDFPSAQGGEFIRSSGKGYTEAPSITHKIRNREASLKERELGQTRFSGKVYAAQVGLGWAQFLKPLFIIGLIILFVVGPGAIAIGALLQAMPWYLWVGAIVLLLVVIRR